MMSKCQQVESSAAMRELEISQREVTVRDQLNGEISRLESKVFQLTETLSKTQRALEDVKSNKPSACDTVKPQPTSVDDNHLRNELDMLNCRLKEAQEFNKKLSEKLYHARNVPHAEYERIRAVLDDLRRRHEEYEEIILGPLHPLCILPDTAIEADDLPRIPESPCRPSVLRHNKSCCSQVPIERIPVNRGDYTHTASTSGPTEQHHT
ncbi:hypothetical protein AHF37_05624 [Paragonimus kellicotti]|nr:hypothetical protein AHF37_05624 [Paragonimus kellicotti]